MFQNFFILTPLLSTQQSKEERKSMLELRQKPQCSLCCYWSCLCTLLCDSTHNYLVIICPLCVCVYVLRACRGQRLALSCDCFLHYFTLFFLFLWITFSECVCVCVCMCACTCVYLSVGVGLGLLGVEFQVVMNFLVWILWTQFLVLWKSSMDF